MKNLKNTITILALVFALAIQAQQTPGAPQEKAISIVGATAHIGNGSIIENALVVFQNGKISYIGASDASKQKGEIIQAKGKHLYPGFILPNSTLGLGEIDAVRPTIDFDEVGNMLPHIRAQIAFNTESKVVESLRPNGILLSQITPRGGRISGTSSVVQLDAWNWEDATIKKDDGIHLNWPTSFKRGRWWMGEAAMRPNKDYNKQIQELANYFQAAQAYLQGTQGEKDLPYTAMKGLFDGSQGLFIHANKEREIRDAIAFAKAQGIQRIVLVGAVQAHKLTDLLVKHQIPVLAARTHSVPDGEDVDYDMPFKLPKILHDAGVVVALENSGQMERMNGRNLPFYAGTVVAYGMSKEDALQMITLNAAKILGIDNHYGSLEVGKSATLFLSKGDALDMRTNILTHAFVDGRKISLETHQTKLYKRYSKKLNQE
ncbi:MAG: amidohydrolase family protein [Flavobacteriaceae bacterium]|nr:amidohydrolase family protein [Flavobacteriaceae bacterium]